MSIRDLIALVLLLGLAGAAWWRQRSLKRVIDGLEHDADVQYQVHRWATWYWVINFPLVAILFWGFPDLWVRIGLLLNTAYSLWANLATDFGAMSAAMAARRSQDSPHLDRIEAKVDELLADVAELERNAALPRRPSQPLP